MNILIFNWRDIRNPEGGGAELLTHEMAKRWVDYGHSVTIFSAAYKNSLSKETIDGVKIIRRGSANIFSGRVPVHISAFFWYIFQKEQFDIVIDEIHGLPFFTPFYVKAKKFVLICEVATEIWDVAFHFPLNLIGKTIEHFYFVFYKHIQFLTISASTKKDILAKGVKESLITILPMGLSAPKNIQLYPKEETPTLIFVARITKAKGVEDALHIVYCLKNSYPTLRLWILGSGKKEYIEEVQHIVTKLDLISSVTFFGRVSEEKKFELMSRAYILIVPSTKEGWGLTVPEAGLVGTPAVGYDVEGLRDVIINKQTGLLSKKSPESLAEKVEVILKDVKLYKKLSSGARSLSKTYIWDNTARTALELFEKPST